MNQIFFENKITGYKFIKVSYSESDKCRNVSREQSISSSQVIPRPIAQLLSGYVLSSRKPIKNGVFIIIKTY